MVQPRARQRALIALAIARGSRGAMAIVGYVVAGLTTLFALAFAPAVRKASAVLLERMPLFTATALAWGAGILVAFAATLQSLRRDRDEGVVALVTLRGHGAMTYVAARVAGLAVLLFVVVAGGSTLTGALALGLANGTAHVVATAQSTVAACVYAACFSAMVAPISFAALGARTRAGGYLYLVLFLFVPEILSGVTGRLVPDGWEELVSVPGVLKAVQGALAPPGVDPLKLVRAIAVTLAVSIAATLAVRAQAARAAQGEPPR